MQWRIIQQMMARAGLTIAVLAAATALAWLLHGGLGGRVPFLTFFPAVMIVAAYAGFWPGIVATLVSGFLAAVLFMAPEYTLALDEPLDLLVLSIFFMTGVMTSAISHRLREARRQAQDAESLLQTVFDHVQATIYVKDQHGVIRRGNRLLAEVLNRPLSEVIGRTDRELFPAADAEQYVSNDQLVLRHGRSIRAEEKVETPEGPRIFLSVKVPLEYAGERLLCGLSVDITERKQAEQLLSQAKQELEQRVEQRTADLRRLAMQMTHAETRERRRIAHLLHDDLQQMLVAARMQVETIRRQVSSGAPAEQAIQLVDESIRLSRDLARDLSPPVLHTLGLAAALRWLGERFRQQHGLVIRLDVAPTTPTADESTAAFVYQAAHELLLNVVKHARTSEATLTLKADPGGSLVLIVSDKGTGLQTNEASPGNSFGLFHIRQRAELLGGSCEIESEPGSGLKVRLTVPCTATV